MPAILMIHIAAGGLGILSGAATVLVRKGARLHRAFGTVFSLAMLMTSVLSVYLAVFVPPSAAGGAPPKASAVVGTLTFYFIVTGWMTARRKQVGVGPIEVAAFLVAAGAAMTLTVFGLQAASITAGAPGTYAPYFVFASFAAYAAALDLKVIVQGGISGARRIARHLWRMCFAFFFACAFFFIGQQKVMPASMHGSPILVGLAVAPLILMVVGLFRIRVKGWMDEMTKRLADWPTPRRVVQRPHGLD